MNLATKRASDRKGRRLRIGTATSAVRVFRVGHGSFRVRDGIVVRPVMVGKTLPAGLPLKLALMICERHGWPVHEIEHG